MFQQGRNIRCLKALGGLFQILPTLTEYLYFAGKLRAKAQAQQSLCITADVVDLVLNLLAGFIFGIECRKGVFAMPVNGLVFALCMLLQIVQRLCGGNCLCRSQTHAGQGMLFGQGQTSWFVANGGDGRLRQCIIAGQ